MDLLHKLFRPRALPGHQVRIPGHEHHRTLLFACIVLTMPACTGPGGGDPTDAAVPEADFAKLEHRLDPGDYDRALLAAALFHETNRVRRQHNLPVLQWNDALQRAADLQADASALKRTADHAHILPSLATPDDRVRHAGLNPKMVGENAALLFLFNTPPAHGLSIIRREDHIVYLDGLTGEPVAPHTYATFAASALQVWLDSPSHRATLLHPDFRYVACSARPTKLITGTEMIACVQVFFTPR